ncbi:MAG: TIGR04282 family arsenosugar biosynthesis glycosyltransferase [Pseudomonadota bacterium]
MKYPQARLLVFSKAPEPGAAKTRLIPLLGAEGAARYYAGMLDNTLDKALAADLCPVELWCTPDTGHAHFQDCRARHPLTLHAQCGSDLGTRMAQALDSVLQRARHALLIGADCPALAGADLAAALQALTAGTDVVLGPAQDGGYYLIGLSRCHPGLFADIPWGSARVLELTLQRCRGHGLTWHCLPEHADLDTPADYLRHHAGGLVPGNAENHCDY